MFAILRTPPRSRGLLLAIQLIIWLGPVMTILHFTARQARGDYPHDADSIFIPIANYLFIFPFELWSLRGLKFYQGGTSLFAWSGRKPLAALLSSIATVFPLGMMAVGMMMEGLNADFYGVTLFFGSRLYTFLLLRCALMKKYDSIPVAKIRCGIALGSNLGHREANLYRGLDCLIHVVPNCRIVARGGVYETEPVDCAPGTQAFLNTAIEIDVKCTPQELHECLSAIEQELGRPAQREKNAPRTLDLDLLYAGDFVSDDPSLTVPHPRLHLRRFVLQPLADIRPDLKLQGHERTIAEHLAALQDDPSCVKRVAASC